MAIYMKWGGINGAVTTAGFEKWIELTSFQMGVGRSIASATRGGQTREAKEPRLSDVTVTKRFDRSSTNLFMTIVAGDLAAPVQIKFTTTTKDKVDTYFTCELSNCGVCGYSVASDGGAPTEGLALNFTKIILTYTERDPKIAGSPDRVGYDLTKMSRV